MSQITNRSYKAQEDQARLIDLLLAYRVATSVQIYSTIWRTRLLLTSRVWNPTQDCRVWEDARGQMLGFAMLWRRRREDAYLVLDRFVQPDLATDALTGAMLAWGVQRIQAIANERAAAITLYAAQLKLATLSNTHLEVQGFRPVAPNPDLYGSYAIGNPHQDSDIDVAIISPDFSDAHVDDWVRLNVPASHIDARMEVLGFRPEQFRDEHPLVWEIKTRGVKLL